MGLEVIYEIRQLCIPHVKMSIGIRRACVYEIEILFRSVFGLERKICISPSSLWKIICSILYLIFTEDHTADKAFGPGSTVDVGIVFLEEILEMLIMIL